MGNLEPNWHENSSIGMDELRGWLYSHTRDRKHIRGVPKEGSAGIDEMLVAREDAGLEDHFHNGKGHAVG